MNLRYLMKTRDMSLNARIVIPSKGRIAKLETCLNSLFLSIADKSNIFITLSFSVISEYEHFYSLLRHFDNISFECVTEYRVPDFWNRHLQNLKESCLIYLNDDVEIFKDTLDIALNDFERHFSDTDGLLGLTQANIHDIHKCQTAFGVIGRKYADRFPNRQVYPIMYERFFGDQEMWLYANKINKFKLSRASLNHYHASLDRTQEDATHRDVRKYLAQDKQTFAQRQSKQLLWGNSFEI